MSDSDTMKPFERRLLDDLLAFRERLPDPPAAPERASRLVPTRRLALVLSGAALLAAAAGAVILATGGNGRTAAPRDAKQLKQRMLLALSGSDDQILYEFTQQQSILESPGGGPGTVVLQGHQDSWEDLSSGRSRSVTYDADGEIRTELASSTAGNVARTEIVVYPARFWQTLSHTLSGSGSSGSQGLADSYRAGVANGFFTLVGTDTIDGVAVLHLRRHQTPPPLPAGFPTPMPFTTDMWVDASTYLPVREEMHEGSTLTSVRTYKWLPRTPANLANLDVVVPPGFKQLTGSDSGGGTFSSTSGGVTLTGGSTSLGSSSSGSSSSGLPAAPAGPPAAPYSGSGFVHQVAQTPAGREDTWTDLTTGRVLETVTDANGDITSEAASSVSGRTIRFDTVDFASRTWTTDYRDYTVTSFLPTGTAPGADASVAGLQTEVALTRLGISQGRYTLVGKETIDGLPALHYRQQLPSGSGTVTFDTWFDASTYLTLRVVTTGDGPTRTETWDWNVPASIGSQKVVFVEPQGFTHTVTHTVH